MGRQTDRERGFALTELLVVAIIIGILAAIAIAVFLSQRGKAQGSVAQSALRNILTAASAEYDAGYPPVEELGLPGGYEIVAKTEPSTGEQQVSLGVEGTRLILAARGGDFCYYARQEEGGERVFREKRSVGGTTDCEAVEFQSGAGTGW